MKNILITSAGRRVELVESFKEEAKKIDKDIKIICIDNMPDLSPACQFADYYFKVPKVGQKKYIKFLQNICEENSIGMVIPTIDTELMIMSMNQDYFSKIGINIVISKSSLIKNCRNKILTAKLFKDIGIGVPIIYDINNLTFPCFVKPYDGSNSIGIFKIMNEDMLTKDILNNPKNIFMEFISENYQEYTVDIYFDRHGTLKSIVPRLRMETRAGEIIKGLTLKGDVYNYLKDKIANLKGARGCITLQLFYNQKTKEVKAIEINPRFGGGYPLSYSAGANFPKMLIQEYLLNENIEFLDNWENNLLMMRYDSKVIINDYKP